MNQIKRKWDRLSDEQKQQAIDGIIVYFYQEKNEKIGYLAAESFLDMMLELISDPIYRKGVSDSRKIMEQKLEDLKIDLDALRYEND